mmetsp:Transcript_32964/g.79743  ORF Transcript_32964/g.79743 Transcript_32964/m.79743 type:complete len:303 (-) Transcript_32964:152-1060(-)
MKRSHAQSFSNGEDLETLWCWSDSSEKTMSTADQDVLLTRKLLHHDWCSIRGKLQTTLYLLEREDQIHSAQGHFDRGCYWLDLGLYSRALFELKKALGLYDKTPTMAEVSVEGQQDFLKRKAKCHYALGLAMMGTSQMDKAEKEVYLAWRISANYEEMESMSKDAEHLMEVALSYKWGPREARCRVICIKNAILHEVSADWMYASGNLRVALGEYRKCFMREEKESYLRIAQAHVRCKLAMVFQALEMIEEASNEWFTALSFYQQELGPDHSRTLATMKRFLEVHRHPCPSSSKLQILKRSA